MRKVYIDAYMEKNLGDDLFIDILVNRYTNFFYGKSKYFYRKNNRNLKIYNHLFFVVINKIMMEINKKYYDVLGDFLAQKANIIVKIGGSIFMENNDLKKWKEKSKCYLKLDKPYYILGANFGPYKNEEFVELVEKNVFEKAEDVCFRDEYSYNKFKHLKNVRKAADIVFSLNIDKFKIENKNQVVISVKKISNELNQKYEQKIIDFIKFFSDKGYKIILMSFCKNEGDEKAIKSILSKVDEKYKNNINQFMYDGNIDKALDVIAKSKIVVGTRFHANILGMLFNKVVIPISYNHKTINTLKDLNFKGKYMDINNMDNFNVYDLTYDDLNYVCDVSEQRKDAENHFKELDKVLEKNEE